MPTLGDLFRAQDTPTEVVGPPEPPKPKTLGDLFRAQDAAAEPPPTRQPGGAGGAMVGGLARREAERAETPELLRRPEDEEPAMTTARAM